MGKAMIVSCYSKEFKRMTRFSSEMQMSQKTESISVFPAHSFSVCVEYNSFLKFNGRHMVSMVRVGNLGIITSR